MSNFSDSAAHFDVFYFLLLISGCSFILQCRLAYICQFTKLKVQLSVNVQVNVVAWLGNDGVGFIYVLYVLLTDDEEKSGKILCGDGAEFYAEVAQNFG
jgi:hypothetical protein